MFLPMKPYHAGGDGASFEPYTEHLQSYSFALSQYLGSVRATVRPFVAVLAPRLIAHR
jgi:hypothetical protein